MKANRQFTFAEKKVNFKNLDRFGKDLSLLLDKKVKKFIPNLAQRKNLEVTKKSLINIVTLIQKEAFDVGKKSAATEMKVRVPPTNKDTIEVMKKSNTQIIEKIISDIQNSLTEKGFSEEGIVSQFINGLKTLFVYGSINMGREVIYEKYPEKIYGFQYSAILDGSTTDLCRSLDGMIIRPEDPKRITLSPPNHWNCRSIWVEILNEETYKPKFESKIVEDPKKIMNKYKDNQNQVGLDKLVEKVKQSENNYKKINIGKISLSPTEQIEFEKEGITDFKENLLIEKKKILNNSIYTDNEIKGISNYSSNYFIKMNSILRKDTTIIKALDKNQLIDQKKNIYFTDKFLSKKENYTGQVYRASTISNQFMIDLMRKVEKGYIYEDNGFMSTSSTLKAAEDFIKDEAQFNKVVVMKINSKTGKNIEDISNFENEKEVLFRPNTKFKVTSLQKDEKKGYYIINMDELDSEEYKEIELTIIDQLGQIYDKQIEKIRKTYK